MFMRCREWGLTFRAFRVVLLEACKPVPGFCAIDVARIVQLSAEPVYKGFYRFSKGGDVLDRRLLCSRHFGGLL